MSETDMFFDEIKIKEWYAREDIMHIFTHCNDFKYLTCMSYNDDKTTNTPRRFQTMANTEKGYKWFLHFNGVGSKKVSIYRDVDNWINKPMFSFDNKIRKEEKKAFLYNEFYRTKIHSTDFVIDVDGDNVYDSWKTAKKITDLYLKFNICFSIYCSGKKGWQIYVPNNKSIKKEYVMLKGQEHNTHEALMFNIKKYIGDKKYIDMSSTGDLRFVKQPYSLDGRNMCPIIPLSMQEFNDFINYKAKPNPYLTLEHWKNEDMRKRWFNWQGTEHLSLVDNFLDELIIKGELK